MNKSLFDQIFEDAQSCDVIDETYQAYGATLVVDVGEIKAGTTVSLIEIQLDKSKIEIRDEDDNLLVSRSLKLTVE